MGGSAFENFGLYTPRIPPDIYKYVLEKTKKDLTDLFRHVESAVEAPEKKDHGDLDILVVPHSNIPLPPISKIANRLHADKWFSIPGSNMYQFAILWPVIHGSPVASGSEQSSTSTHSDPASNTAPMDSKPLSPLPSIRHIQIDLSILPDEPSLRWALFTSAHGDLVNILASIIKHKGLTINNQALYLRIADLEAENRKLARVKLSKDPDQVLNFLNLDAARFWQPFSQLNDMMEYIAHCRFHDSKKLSKGTATVEVDNSDTDNRPAPANPAKNTYTPHYSRPVFAYWRDVFRPAHVDDPPGPQAHLSREEVLDFVFDYFGEDTRQHYLTQSKEAGAFVARSRLWPDIRKQILKKRPDMQEKEMQDIIRALKREITSAANTTANNAKSGNTDPRSRNASDQSASLTQVQQAYRNNDFDTVILWAVENYATALEQYRKLVEQSNGGGGDAFFPLDNRKANPFSTTELETYTAGDDEVISRMKRNGKTWGEILSVLGKKSRSQLVAHWKRDLDPATGTNPAAVTENITGS